MTTRSKGLHITLWGVQVLLAAMFGLSGAMKATTPIPALANSAPWAADVPEALVRFIGVAELAGAAGLLLPALTRILPVLTPLAATGLAIIMVLAVAFHVSRSEPTMLPINLVLGAVAAFVAWGRFGPARIEPRR